MLNHPEQHYIDMEIHLPLLFGMSFNLLKDLAGFQGIYSFALFSLFYFQISIVEEIMYYKLPLEVDSNVIVLFGKDCNILWLFSFCVIIKKY